MQMSEDDILSTSGFQAAIDRWCNECFGPDVTKDKRERADRFIEEALELAQTMPGFTRERAHALVDYVFDRPEGETLQEVGGVMVTFAALVNAVTMVSIGICANTEFARIVQPEVMLKIREKQAMKRLIHNLVGVGDA